MSDFEMVIGLEVHCQLATESKLFSRAPARLKKGESVSDQIPNSRANPVCAGHPGTLPVLNKKAVEYAVRAGIATGCKINKRNVFARKHYFYPDLPKGYQISQFEEPICTDGAIEIEPGKKIGITRIHMEEDAGKSVHKGGYSLVNLNRAGVPLIEIVSEPDMRSAQEAGAYLRQLYSIVTFIEITDGNLQEGNFRCDVNLSVRKAGESKLGTRTEIKNINSFRFVEKAIEFESARQIELITSGGKVTQETRLFDSEKGVTVSMRSKEDAHDYRYFPDPDLLPLDLDSKWIEKIKSELPELPKQKVKRYKEKYKISDDVAEGLVSSRAVAEFYENVCSKTSDGRKSAGNLTNDVIVPAFQAEKISEVDLERLVDPVSQTASYIGDGSVSFTGAKQVVAHIIDIGFDQRIDVKKIIDELGLTQVSDTSALEPIIDEILTNNPKQVAEFRAGKVKVMGFFVGQAMKASKGSANPGVIQKLLKEKLSK